MQAAILTMPGIGNSGPTHWQSLWEEAYPSIRRIQVDDWDRPVCASWTDAIEHAVTSAERPVVIAAHSLGCLAVAEWTARGSTERIAGIMFVSVPDPHGPCFPAEASGFNPPAQRAMPFQSIVVSSEDDPYGTADYMRRCAQTWGSRFVNVGAAGHINAASNLGKWDAGWQLLQTLL